jgi:hypothetical protein
VAQQDVITVRPSEERALWRRPGGTQLQVRLARYGWGWSGAFDGDVGVAHGPGSSASDVGVGAAREVPLRLQNDHDGTVFFVMARVMLKVHTHASTYIHMISMATNRKEEP